MKKVVILCFVSVLSVFMLAGCQRDEGVQAGNEQGNTGTYQPRPAPKGDLQSKESGQNQEISGELQRVDMAAKTMTVRLDNGMEQTFKFDDSTMVMGLEGQQGQTTPAKPGKATNAAIRNLVGKEGSEVMVQWRDDDGAKMATQINVTQISTAKRSRNSSSGTNATTKPKTKSTY
jgi:uncharacterized protein YcfL